MPDTPWRKIKAFSTEQDAKNFADEWCLEDGHWIDIMAQIPPPQHFPEPLKSNTMNPQGTQNYEFIAWLENRVEDCETNIDWAKERKLPNVVAHKETELAEMQLILKNYKRMHKE